MTIGVRDLTVEPLATGWAVTGDGELAPTVFRSGAAAESAARRLATRLAQAGVPVRLTVKLRDHSVGGRFLFPPALDPSSSAAA